jgi:hypothetical protein
MNSRLKISHFTEFTDPFELKFGIDEHTATNNIHKEYGKNRNIIKKWENNLEEDSIAYDKNSPQDIINKFTELQIADFKNVVANVLRKLKMGIICLSESPNIIQMWAHYADNHTRIVIGLDENEFVNDKEALIKVRYRDDMVLFPVTGIIEKFNKYVIKYIPEVISRKESNWSYEKEIRLYAMRKQQNADGIYYYKIPSSSIKELYLGLNSDKNIQLRAESLKQREEYKHLKIYKMTNHESAFK